jgi:hypothetical protein
MTARRCVGESPGVGTSPELCGCRHEPPPDFMTLLSIESEPVNMSMVPIAYAEGTVLKCRAHRDE